MVERDGWRQPSFYSSVEQESQLLNTGVGVYDISPSGKLLLQGNDLDGLLRDIFSTEEALTIGEMRRVSLPACGRLARLTTDEYLLLCDAAELPEWTEVLVESPPDCVHVFGPHFRLGRCAPHRAQVGRIAEQALGVGYIPRDLPQPTLRPDQVRRDTRHAD